MNTAVVVLSLVCLFGLAAPQAAPAGSAGIAQGAAGAGSINVNTAADFVAALARDNVTTAVVLSSFSLNDSDFDAFPSPIIRTTNLTITGPDRPQAEWPVVGLGFVRGKVRLDGPAALLFERVVVRDFRATPLGQSPGFDLVATSVAEAGALVMLDNSIMMLRICVPRSIQSEIMASIARPASMPGEQLSLSNVSQANCTQNTTSPPVERCWPDLGVYVDVAVAGFDIDAFGRASATRYNLYMLNVPYLCERQMTDDCVAALGPLGCYLYMFPRMPITNPPPASPVPTPVPVTESESSTPIGPIIGGVVGGVVVVTLIAGGAFMVVRRKRQRQEAARKAAEEASRLARAASARSANGQPPPGSGPNGAGGGSAMAASSNGSAPVSAAGMQSGVAKEASGVKRSNGPGSSQGTSLQHSVGKGPSTVLPNGVGTCVLSSADVDASSPLVIVTPFTPHRSDLKLDVQCDTEVQLLPIIRGKGSYGRVVEGLYAGQRVAVKLVVDVDEWSGPTDSLVSSFSQEVEVLGRCQHPNIVRLLAACLKPPRLCLVMELMDTSLERLVHGKQGDLLPLQTVLHIAADIARGLAYLHPTIIHRDLKPGNVLLSHVDRPRPIAKLTDFGLSRLRSTVLVTRHPEAGTPAYMAPEAFDASNYIITHKADIYALGVILWEMLTGSVPWEGCSMVAIAYSITVRHHRLPLSKLDANRCPPKLRKLIHQCWDPDPQRRPAAAELVKQLTLVMQMIQGEGEVLHSSANSSIRSGDHTPNVAAPNSKGVAAHAPVLQQQAQQAQQGQQGQPGQPGQQQQQPAANAAAAAAAVGPVAPGTPRAGAGAAAAVGAGAAAAGPGALVDGAALLGSPAGSTITSGSTADAKPAPGSSMAEGHRGPALVDPAAVAAPLGERPAASEGRPALISAGGARIEPGAVAAGGVAVGLQEIQAARPVPGPAELADPER